MRIGDTVSVFPSSKTAQTQEGARLCDQGGSPLHLVITDLKMDDEDRTCLKFAETGNLCWYAFDFRVIERSNPGDEIEYQQDDAFNGMQAFQQGIRDWVSAAFSGEHAYTHDGEPITTSVAERNDRLFEETGELVQALGMTRAQAHLLVDMVWDKEPEPVPEREVGGVLSTLAALCNVHKYDMWKCAVQSLKSNWERIDKIREKNKTKQAAMRAAKPAQLIPSDSMFTVSKLHVDGQAFSPTVKLRWNIHGRLEQLHQGEPRGEFTESKWVEVPFGAR